MQQLWGRKLPNFSFYRCSQGFRGLPESHSERQLRQSSVRLIPAVEKSEGISGYLNKGTGTHLFKASVWLNIHYFDGSSENANMQTDKIEWPSSCAVQFMFEWNQDTFETWQSSHAKVTVKFHFDGALPLHCSMSYISADSVFICILSVFSGHLTLCFCIEKHSEIFIKHLF